MINELRDRGAKSAAFGAFVGTLFGGGAISFGTFPLFLDPVSQEFGWGRGNMSTAFGLGGLLGALAAPLVGRLVDKFGPRRVLTGGIALYGLSFMALGLQQGSVILLGLNYALIMATGLAGAIPFFKVLVGWFRENRGLMMGIINGGGTGLGVALAVVAARLLVTSLGWREAYFVLGAAILLIPLPLVALLVRENANANVMPAENVSVVAPDGMATKEALRSKTFWMLLGAIVLGTVATGAFGAHAYAYLTDRDIAPSIATTVISLTGLGSLVGQVGAGLVLDRTRSARGAVIFVAAGTIGLAMILWSKSAVALIAGGALLGIGSNPGLAIAPYLISRFFGLRSFSEIQGFTLVGATLAMATGPALLGIAFDRLGSYSRPMDVLLACATLAVVLLWMLPGYRYNIASPMGADVK